MIILIGTAIYINYEKPKTLSSNNKQSNSVPSQPVIYEPVTEEDYVRLEEILP